MGDSFHNHPNSEKSQQAESDPMIHSGDILFELCSEQIADKGHQSLKQTEPQAYPQTIFYRDPSERQSFADGDGAGVHGDPYCQDEQFP